MKPSSASGKILCLRSLYPLCESMLKSNLKKWSLKRKKREKKNLTWYYHIIYVILYLEQIMRSMRVKLIHPLNSQRNLHFERKKNLVIIINVDTYITLPTKAHLVKSMVFPVVMYGCESQIINKAEHRRIDAFELRCWRRLLRVPWTARRSNQAIL